MKNIYVTWLEEGSGKTAIVVTIIKRLLSKVVKVGFFRPIITSKEDYLTAFVQDYFQLENCSYGILFEEAQNYIQSDKYEELMMQILQHYKDLESKCDIVLCVGSDYGALSEALTFDFNIDVANNLDTFLLPIIKGYQKNSSEIMAAIEGMLYTLKERDADLLACIVNRVQEDRVSDVLENATKLQLPLYCVIDDPVLALPSVGDLMRALDAKLLYGSKEFLARDVMQFKIAAMELDNFLSHLQKGDVIITPADRADIILGALLSFGSENYDEIAGIVLTGNFALPSNIAKLIQGLRRVDVPILKVQSDTFTTATAAHALEVQLNPKNRLKIARAVGIVEDGVDFETLSQKVFTVKKNTKMTPMMFEYSLLSRAKEHQKHIVLPEGDEARILKAVAILVVQNIVQVTLLGNVERIQARIKSLNLSLEGVSIIDPKESELRKKFAKEYAKIRAHKHVTIEHAYDAMEDVNYFGTMYVHMGYADGMVSGAVHTTGATVRPALEIIKTAPESSIVSSVFFMCLKDRVLVYGDCAINPNPDAQQLCDIALTSAKTAKKFGIEPKVAMLSYSTGSSGKGSMVDKVIEATQCAHTKAPKLLLEGPIQYDAAIDKSVAKVKLPDSKVAGEATVFIFPDLNTGNNTYKAVQRSAGALAIGPVLQGLNKPINDLSRGCLVEDVVNTIAITAIQSQGDAL